MLEEEQIDSKKELEEKSQTKEETTRIKNKRTTDAYLESLVFLAKYYQKTVSKDSLAYGVVSQGSFMDLKGFLKASSRIGLISKTAKRKLKDISKLALPALLVLENNRACVLLDINIEENKAKVILPGLAGETVMSVPRIVTPTRAVW